MELRNALELKADSDAAVIVLHEIYGVNRHILDLCADYQALGFDVYCPDLYDSVKPFPYNRQTEAYEFFMNHVGFEIFPSINDFAAQLRPRHTRLFLLGSSVGATLAWLCGNSGLYDGVVCCYGSRIRDYAHLPPACPTLAFFARHEKSFPPESVESALSGIPVLQVETVDAGHGFCDKYSEHFDAKAATYAEKRIRDFLKKLRRVPI